MQRHPLLTLPVMVLLAVADGVTCLALAGKSAASLPAASAVLSQLPAVLTHPANSTLLFALHFAFAIPAALLGAAALGEATRPTRITLAVFFLVLTLTIPIVGILITAALACVLRQPSLGGLRPEERFVFGNPEVIAARRESRDPHPDLIPLAASFRDMDEDTLSRVVLGLKHLGPVSAIAPFLRRFQQDPRTSIQFSAQAVLTGAIETLEETVRVLRARAASEPQDPETALALASTLHQLADWTPPGDTTATLYRRDATALLLPLQNHPTLQHRVLPLLARQQLTPKHTTAATTAATTFASRSAHLAHLQSLFLQSRWDDLAAAATQLSPNQSESLAFWTQSPALRSTPAISANKEYLLPSLSCIFPGILLFAFASLTIFFAVTAVFHDRFRKPIACLLCLLSAVAPWICLLPFFDIVRFPLKNALIIFSLFGALPLLIFSFFLFGIGKPYPERTRSAAFALAGMFSSVITLMMTFNLFTKWSRSFNN